MPFWGSIPILKSAVMQVVFINECKPCEISNQMFFNVMFLFSKIQDELVMTCTNNLFHVQIQDPASRSTTTREFVFLAIC